MKEIKISIRDNEGLNVHDALKIVERAQTLSSRVQICTDKMCADAISIVELLLLDVKKGTELSLRIEGDEEDIAANAIVKIFL